MNETLGRISRDTWRWSAFEALSEAEMSAERSGKIARTPWSDFLDRYGTMSIHEAELFHCNSRISSASQVNLALPEDRICQIRTWMDGEAYVPTGGALDDQESERLGFTKTDLDGGLQRVVTDAGEDACLAVELYVCVQEMIYRVRNQRLWLERRLSTEDTEKMSGLLHLDRPRCHREVRYLVLYVGFPWRYMALQGPRGYRRMLIELGKRISRVEQLLQAAGLAATTSLDFYDVAIESFLGFDGIETTLLATTAATCSDGYGDAVP